MATATKKMSRSEALKVYCRAVHCKAENGDSEHPDITLAMQVLGYCSETLARHTDAVRKIRAWDRTVKTLTTQTENADDRLKEIPLQINSAQVKIRELQNERAKLERDLRHLAAVELEVSKMKSANSILFRESNR